MELGQLYTASPRKGLKVQLPDNSMPIVTIGIPVFNGAKYLSQAIESVLSQTYKNFKLVISDNHSSDETEDICRRYLNCDERITYIRQSKNIGGFENYCFLIEKCTTKYFMLLACDDYYGTNETLEGLVEKIESGFDYAFPNVDVIYEGSSKIDRNLMASFEGANSAFDFALGSIDMNTYQLYALFNIKILKRYWKIQEKCSKYRAFAEGLFVHAISTSLKGGYVKNSKFIYRRHDKNISSTIPSNLLLIDLMKYYIRSCGYFMGAKEIKPQQKIYLLLIMSLKRFEYMIYLGLVSLRNYLKNFKN